MFMLALLHNESFWRCFSMARVSYPADVKWAVVKEKLAGELTIQEIMEKYGIKNKSQITTWMKWYQNNELHRFDQPVGKQYTYGYGPEGASKQELLNRKIIHLEIENDILKKFMEIAKELNGK